MSPQDFLDAMIFQRGYSTSRYTALDSGYYNEPTALQEASYTSYITSLVDQNDVSTLRTLLTSGLSPNPSNYSGSTLAHYICRVGRVGMLRMLFEIGCDIRIADAEGRTPLHELCKRSVPCFEMVEMIMRYDIRMFYMIDQRDIISLARVPKDKWAIWNRFLDSKKDSFWPYREHTKMGNEPPPPLTLVKANTRIVHDPPNNVPIHQVQFLASGGLNASDGNCSDKDDSITWVDDWPKALHSLKDVKKTKASTASTVSSHQKGPIAPPTNIVVSHLSPTRSTKQLQQQKERPSPIVIKQHEHVSSTPPRGTTKGKSVVSLSPKSVKSLGRQNERSMTSTTTQIPANIFTSIIESNNTSPLISKPQRTYTISTTSTAATKTCTTGSTVTDLTYPKHIDSRIVDLDNSIDNDDSGSIECRDEDHHRTESRRERRRSKSLSRAARSKSRQQQRSRRKPPAFYIERVAV
jgi:hypothetical protein